MPPSPCKPCLSYALVCRAQFLHTAHCCCPLGEGMQSCMKPVYLPAPSRGTDRVVLARFLALCRSNVLDVTSFYSADPSLVSTYGPQPFIQSMSLEYIVGGMVGTLPGLPQAAPMSTTCKRATHAAPPRLTPPGSLCIPLTHLAHTLQSPAANHLVHGPPVHPTPTVICVRPCTRTPDPTRPCSAPGLPHHHPVRGTLCPAH